MRRLLLAATLVLAGFAGTANAYPDLPCDHWFHGCDVKAYVYDACRYDLHADCGIV
jgi:hypothetical protein